MIKVLIVDDSGFMRVAIRKMVENDPQISIIGEARDGEAALRMVEALEPNIVTMDVEMPGMDGLTATREIMARFPRPIIMVSSVTQAAAPATIKALEYGAVDFISKTSSFVALDIVKVQNELRSKIRYWGMRPYVGAGTRRAKSIAAKRFRGRRVIPSGDVDIAVVAVSTGGPRMFREVLDTVEPLSFPIVVAQHMPANFTSSFAAHLRQETGLDVVEGEQGMKLDGGKVVILPGGADGAIRRSGSRFYLSVRLDPSFNFHPSADLLFTTAADAAHHPVAIILTGMGSDGTKGAREFHTRGWPVLVQEPRTCVVDGMPSAAIAAGVATEVLTLGEIGRRLTNWDRLSGTTPQED